MVRPAHFLGVVLLSTACSEHKVEVSNSNPVAVITSPSDGSSVEPGEVVVTGSVSDPDDGTETLMASWLVDDELICEAEAPTEFGNTSCLVTLSGGEAEIRLQVRDSGDAVGIDAITVTAEAGDPPDDPPNSPPTCAITSPASDALLGPDEELLLSGTASDPDQEAHTLTAVWRSDSDGLLGTTAPNTDGVIQLVADALSAGLHVLSLTVTDDLGELCLDSVSIRAGTAPEISIMTPVPGEVLEHGVPTVLSAVVSDAEDSVVDLSIHWDLVGTGVIGTTAADDAGYTSLDADLDVGEHTVTATVTDLHGQTATDSVTFAVDDVPVVADVNISPNPAWASDPLTCSWTFSDSGGVDASEANWAINGVAAGAGTTLSTGYVHGDTVSCTVTPSDGVLTGAADSDSLVISNSLPSVASVTISPSSPTATDTLSCSYTGYADLDGEPDASTMAWRVNGVLAGAGSSLSGVFVRGDEVSCTVTPNDGTDAGVPVSATVTIENTVPEALSVMLTPEMVYTNTVVSALSVTTDAEGDSVSLTHTWTVDGGVRPETGSSLSGLIHFDKHQVVSVMVTPSDDFGGGTPVSGGSITVLNSPPTPPSLIFIPEAPVEGVDDVWCAVDAPAEDLDADGVSLSFEWSVDGVPWTGTLMSTVETDDTVSLSETVAGQEWTCTVTPHDGDEPGEAVSATVIIDNAETRVFVTNEATSSDMGGPSGGDDFCNELAEAAGLGGSWVAYLSGGGASAITRIPDGPYVRMDGEPIADDKSDLTDGSIANPILINQLGGSTSTWVCTGSSEAGYATGPSTASGGNCEGWTRGCGVCDGDHWYVETGRSDRTSDDWSTAGWNFCGSCYLYCFEA